MPTPIHPVAIFIFGTIELATIACLADPRADKTLIQAPTQTATNTTANFSLVQELRYRTANSGLATPASPLGNPTQSNPDTDLRLTLDGEVRSIHERLRGQVSAALWLDVDGNKSMGEPDLFAEAHDGRTRPVGVVYTLSAEWRQGSTLDYLRFGRQESTFGLPLTFDGGALGLSFWKRQLSLFALGGHTLHFFESQTGLLENWVGCAGAKYRPNANAYWELDSRFEHEAVRTDNPEATGWIQSHSYGLSFTARSEESWGKLFIRGLNRKASQAGAAFRLAIRSIAFGMDAHVRAQLRTLGEISETEHPFYSILGASLPHLRAQLELWKEIELGGNATLSLRSGWRIRQLLGYAERAFNHNSGGIYSQAAIHDLGFKGLFAYGILEWNYLPWSLSNDSFFSLGGAAGYTHRKFSFEAGTTYQRWKITYYRDALELQDARTLYGSVSIHALPWLEIRAHSSLEFVDRMIQSTYLSLREVI
jgi:hypothetical protein